MENPSSEVSPRPVELLDAEEVKILAKSCDIYWRVDNFSDILLLVRAVERAVLAKNGLGVDF